MDALHWNLEVPCIQGSLSLTDVKKKLFPKRKFDRTIELSEEKYTEKTLEGNWFERRAVYVPQSDDWRTSYDINYKPHVNKTWRENQDTKWDNILKLEGLAREQLLNHREEYNSNMTTTYDLQYNILPKDPQGSRIRSYNARQKKWVPELDLTESFGSLTEFGLRDILKEEIYKNSDEGIAKCRWWSTYRDEIGRLKPITTERIVNFRRRKVDFNVPDLKHLERKLPYPKYCNFR